MRKNRTIKVRILKNKAPYVDQYYIQGNFRHRSVPVLARLLSLIHLSFRVKYNKGC